MVEISNGDLLDKLSILRIKEMFITDTKKSLNIKSEIDTLAPLCSDLLSDERISQLYLNLVSINTNLWEVEDRIRAKERLNEFDAEFIELARSVYYTNDNRSAIKREINLISGSRIIEEKDYPDYR